MRFSLLLLATLSPADGPDAAAAAADKGDGLRVVTPKDRDVIAVALNGRGDLVGFEWVEEPDRPGVIEQKPFLARGKAVTYLPRLKGYTATFPAGVSDGGLVAGHAGKPAPRGVRVFLRNQAFVWDEAGGIRGLGVPEGDSASFATGVSRDGLVVAGYSTGDGRRRACVWDRRPGGEVGVAWRVTTMPHAEGLTSNVVAVSNDGRRVAAVDGRAPCLWTRAGGSDAWTREVIGGDGSLVPRAVNDSGTVAGLRYSGDGRTHAVVRTAGAGVVALDEPAGYVRSEALAVNNAGVVVGTVDGPNGSKTGPDPFVYERGRLRLITEGGPNFSSATTVNDRREVSGVFEVPEE